MITASKRRKGKSSQSNQQSRPVRCAIYTRKSTSEGLDREFTSLDAQRESGESFVASMRHEGWECLEAGYDDGGYSGGTLERPALQRLLADIKTGQIDCVIVYKVDRLSRSLMDFTKIMEVFDQSSVSFVSVTQQFNTTTSMGRLMLNVLLSFAQFEREIISERTRDKIAAARRKGKWSGGQPVLGYDVVDAKLVVNEQEAAQVREIFRLYLEHRSLLDVVRELRKRGWTTKRWETKKGTYRGGAEFTRATLRSLLQNPLYIGQVRYRDELYDGEQEAIVEAKIFQRVQDLLDAQRRPNQSRQRFQNGGILTGLIRCRSCDCAMVHTWTRKRNRLYRYYSCSRAKRLGHDVCTAPSVSAPEVERFVVDQVRVIGQDPALVAATLEEVAKQSAEQAERLGQETLTIAAQIQGAYAELSRIAVEPDAVDRMAQIQDEIDRKQRRIAEIRSQQEALNEPVDRAELQRTLEQFNPLWETLKPAEQHRVLRLLLEQIEFDGAAEEVTLTFQAHGVQTLLEQNLTKESAA